MNLRARASRLDFPSFVFLFSALTLIGVAFYTFHPSFSLSFYAIYAVGAVSAAFLASAGSLFTAPPAEASNSIRSDIALGLLIFLFGLALGLYRLDHFSIWLDEEVQAFATRGWPGHNIVGRAASSQQMPLGYFVTALNWDLGGNTEWGLRLFSCFFIAGSGVLFFRLAKQLCKSRLVYSISPFIYLLNPWLIRYSQEGRPYGLIMFCGLLWLNSVHGLFAEKGSCGRPITYALVVFASTLLFLMSASLQPLILCASFLLVFGFFFFSPSWRKTVWAFYASVITAILAVIPLIQLTREASTHFFFSDGKVNILENFLRHLQSIPKHTSSLFLEQAHFLAIVYIFAPLTLIGPGRRAGGAIWVGLASCLVFGAMFLAPFSFLINYPVFVRYFIIAYPLGLLVIIVYFDQLSAFFDGKQDRMLKRGWQLIFLAALAAPSLRALPDVYYSKKFDRWNFDSKSLFSFFRQDGREGDVGYVIAFDNPDRWAQVGFLATKYYYPSNTPVRVTSFQEVGAFESTADLILKDLNAANPSQVFLTFIDPPEPGAAALRQYCAAQTGRAPRQGDLFLVCHIPVKDGLSKTLEGFFTGLVRAVEQKEMTYQMYDILLHLAEYEKNPRKCQAYLTDLKRLKLSGQVVQNIIQNHEKKCLSAARTISDN